MVSDKSFERFVLLNRSNVEKAVNAMKAAIQNNANNASDLLQAAQDDDQFVTLNFALDSDLPKAFEKKFPVKLGHLKHSIYQQGTGLFEGKGICLIVGDKNAERVKAVLEEDPVMAIKRVISVSELKKDFNQFKDKRDLVASFDMFFLDYLVKDLAFAYLGKSFFSRKKQPYAIHLTAKNPRKQILDAVNSTFLLLKGSAISVKIGRVGMTEEQIVDNAMAVHAEVVSYFPRGKGSLLHVSVKVHEVTSFPVYLIEAKQTVKRVESTIENQEMIPIA